MNRSWTRAASRRNEVATPTITPSRTPGVKAPGDDGHHDKSESARPGSDTGDGRCEALEWLAANLRWNRTLDVLRASPRANDH